MWPPIKLSKMIERRARQADPDLSEETLQELIALSDRFTKPALESFRILFQAPNVWITATKADFYREIGCADDKGRPTDLGRRFYRATEGIPPQLWPDKLP